MYYGDLGHRDCPGREVSEEEKDRQSRIETVGVRHGWDKPTTREKIMRVREILHLDEENAIGFLLESPSNREQNVIDKLEDDHPPF